MTDSTFKREDDFAAMNIDAVVEGSRSLEDLIAALTGMKEAYDNVEGKDKRKIDLSVLTYDELPEYLPPSDYIEWCEAHKLVNLMTLPGLKITDFDITKACPDTDAYGCSVDWMHDELEWAIIGILQDRSEVVFQKQYEDGFYAGHKAGEKAKQNRKGK